MKKIVTIVISMLALTGCTSQKSIEKQDITGEWAIQKAMGISTLKGENPAFINFDKNGKMNGNTSVNLFSGEYKLDGQKLTLSQIGMTRRMGESMEIEDSITRALNAVASMKAENGKLYIFNAKKDTIMVLSK